MHIYIYIYVYIYVYTHTYCYTYSLYVCMYIYIYVFTYVCIDLSSGHSLAHSARLGTAHERARSALTCRHACVYTYISLYICTYYIYIYIYTYTYIYIYIYTHNAHVCVNTHIYTYVPNARVVFSWLGARGGVLHRAYLGACP